MSPVRPGRTRPALLVGGIILILVVGGLVAYKSSWVRSLFFGREAENVAEMAALGNAKLAVAPTAEKEAGWPQWRGPMRDGRAPAGPIRIDWDRNPPKQLWKFSCGGGYSSLAVAGGRVYGHDRTADGERVFCLDAETGAKLWEYAYPADYKALRSGYATGPRATPTVAGNRVYAVGTTGKLVCLESPMAGDQPRLVWEHDLVAEFQGEVPTWGVACSPLVEGDLLIVQPGGKTGAVVAFDRETGTVRWKAGSNPAGYSSPMAATVGGVRVVYALLGDALLCVRAADGAVMGQYPWATQHRGNIATPIVVDDYVFISSAYNKGCALLRAVPSGDQVRLEEVYARNNRVLRSHHATAVYKDGYLYGFDDTRRTYPQCVDFRKGVEVADWGAGAEVESGTLILTDRHLVIQTEKGDVILAEATPEEFRPVARHLTGFPGAENWALPVLVDGRLYLRGSDRVVCLDVRP
jgi:outer membrane protein assembly factor BamB